MSVESKKFGQHVSGKKKKEEWLEEYPCPKKGKEHVPHSFYPRKAPGILQVQAKTNTRALKSPVLNPCVITQAASPHITKT